MPLPFPAPLVRGQMLTIESLALLHAIPIYGRLPPATHTQLSPVFIESKGPSYTHV